MRSHSEAMDLSIKIPSEILEFKEISPDGRSSWAGFLLNGEYEGVFEYYRSNKLIQRDVYNSKTLQAEHRVFRQEGSIRWHHFSHRNAIHGECKRINYEGTIYAHHFYISGNQVDDLDYLINEPRDAAFYVTLALHGISKEFAFN